MNKTHKCTHKPSRTSLGRRVSLVAGTGVLGLFLVLATSFPSLIRFQPVPASYDSIARWLGYGASFDETRNSQEIQKWRNDLLELSQTAKSNQELEALIDGKLQVFQLPRSRTEQPRGDSAVQKCKHVVLDFGANIGDTFGHVVDAGMPTFQNIPSGVTIENSWVHLDIVKKTFGRVKKLNTLALHLKRVMQKHNGPEEYCYYGIEGNPVFTERLQDIEDFAMALRPRPIQHIHFFTQTVGTGADGMTKLYLDRVNVNVNFWGSSIFAAHPDVVASARNKDVESVAVPVMGYTIGTLMRKTMQALDPKASSDNKTGSHLIVKVDIEGAEYPLLHQAIQEGTLCNFLQMGNTVDFYVEFHGEGVTGPNEHARREREMRDHLTSCGATFHTLVPDWQ